MQKNNSYKIDESLLEKIIAVAYGDAGMIDKITIYKMAKTDPLVKQLLNEYKLTAASVHKIKEIELPAITSDSARVKMDEEINSNPIGLFIYSKLFARPVLSTGVAGLLIIVIAGILFFKNPVPEYKYTQLEIEFAQKKLQASIAIVNKVFRKVETELDKEVMPNRVGKHINKGFNVLNDFVIGG